MKTIKILYYVFILINLILAGLMILKVMFKYSIYVLFVSMLILSVLFVISAFQGRKKKN